jgi:hypothetical protein
VRACRRPVPDGFVGTATLTGKSVKENGGPWPPFFVVASQQKLGRQQESRAANAGVAQENLLFGINMHASDLWQQVEQKQTLTHGNI